MRRNPRARSAKLRAAERLGAKDHAEPFEYAIKKDVRNNAIVREVDEARQRDLWKSVGVAALSRAGPAVLGVAALRVAAARLPGRGNAAGDERAEEELDAPPAPRDRDTAVAQAHRIARDRPAASRRARAGRGDRDRTRRATGEAAGQVRSSRGGEQSCENRPHRHDWRDDAATARRTRRLRRALRPVGRGHRSPAGLPAGVPQRRSRRRAPSASRADDGRAGQTRRHPRPQGPGAGDQRRRRHDLSPCRRKSRIRPASSQALCGALRRLQDPGAADA